MTILPSKQASSTTKISHSQSMPPFISLLPSLPPSDKPAIHPPRMPSSPSSSSSPSSERPKQRTLDEKTEIVALNMIILQPKEPDGYLLAGKLYEKQQRYTAARAIYAHSRYLIPPTHARYDELQLRLKRIDMKRASFVQLLPYDVTRIIFNQLTSDELLECSNVTLSWNFFVLQWPEFWDRLIDGGYNMNPAMALSFLDVGEKEEERRRLCIQSMENTVTPRAPMRMSNTLVSSMLKFVTAPGACSIREIHFERVVLQREHVDLLVEGVQSRNAKIERISFYYVDLGSESYALMILLGRCSQLKHFSFNESRRVEAYGRMHKRGSYIVPYIGYRMHSDGIPYHTYMLTTLDLSMGCANIEGAMLPDLVKRSPFLKRLRISFMDYAPHGAIMRAAVDHCHSLEDLLVMDFIGKSVFDEDRREDILDDSRNEGLQRFALYDSAGLSNNRLMPLDDILYVIRKHHTTLSVFHLENYFLMSLTYYRFPQLHELYLHYNAPQYKRPPIVLDSQTFSQFIIDLAQCCPKLQVLSVYEPPGRAKESVYPFTEDDVLYLIEHCHFLEQMRIDTIGLHFTWERSH